MPNGVNNPIQSCPLSKEKKDDKKDSSKTQWIKFNVVHYGDNTPLQGVVIDLTLPNDNTTVIESDEKGMVEINNIDEGSCHLNIDWRELIDMGYTIDQMVIIKL